MPQAQDLLFDKDDSPMFLSNFLKALTQAPRPVLLTASAVHVVAAEAVMAQISFGMLLSCCFWLMGFALKFLIKKIIDVTHAHLSFNCLSRIELGEYYLRGGDIAQAGTLFHRCRVSCVIISIDFSISNHSLYLF
jgi:hypothetical protein